MLARDSPAPQEERESDPSVESDVSQSAPSSDDNSDPYDGDQYSRQAGNHGESNYQGAGSNGDSRSYDAGSNGANVSQDTESTAAIGSQDAGSSTLRNETALTTSHMSSANIPCTESDESGRGLDSHVTSTAPLTPAFDDTVCTPVHLDGWNNNSCHFNCMVPVFLVINQVTPLSTGSDVTEQAKAYFSVIKDVDVGKHERIDSRVKVSVRHHSDVALMMGSSKTY